MKLNDLTGQRFGRLVVLHRVQNQGMNRQWLCHCDCGIEKVIGGRHLTSGKTLSCGCYRSENKPNLKHGQRHSWVYKTWCGIKYRCDNQNATGYKNYGGRGIRICDEWRNDFVAFYEHVLALPNFGEPGYSLDRINNDGDYAPGNVRWATSSLQATNRRKRALERDEKGVFVKSV